jgi:tetratricopeptide (TPR) repeat protein
VAQNQPGAPKMSARANAYVKWLEESASEGIALAQKSLAEMFMKGIGVEQDVTQAVFWYRKAAEQGDATAQANLGMMYDSGQGVEQDAKQAVVWYRKAAEQGNARAQTNLGLMYDSGQGVERDAKQAVVWYRKAAEQGNARAQTNLGLMYESGRGIEKNVFMAAYFQLLGGLKINVGEKLIRFKYSVSDEVMECIPDVIKNYREFDNVRVFTLHEFRFGRREISAIDRLIRLNTSIETIKLYFDDDDSDESDGGSEDQGVIDAFANQLADTIQAFNTRLTKLNFFPRDVGEVEQVRLYQLLEQNRAIRDLRQELRKEPPKKSDDLPLEVLELLADKLIVTGMRSGKTKEATQAAVDEFLISAQFGVMTGGSAVTRSLL